MLLQLIQFYRHITNRKFGWFGNYSNWNDAKAASGGYNAENILQKVKASTLKVKNGEAIFERDGMLVDQIEYSWPLPAQRSTQVLRVGLDLQLPERCLFSCEY